MNSKVSDDILVKIQGLIAMRDGASSPGEVANAISLINKLLTKYNIDLMDVQNHKKDDGVFVEKGKFDDYQTPYDGKFAQSLLSTLAAFNYCNMVIHPSKVNKGAFTILGKKHNIAVTSYMFDYCLNNIKILFNKHWEKHSEVIDANKNTYRRSFYQGAVLAIQEKLVIKYEEAKVEHGEAKMNELMRLNDSSIQEKTKELFPETSPVRKQKLNSNMDGLVMGYQEGKKLQLEKGLAPSENMKTIKDKNKLLEYGR